MTRPRREWTLFGVALALRLLHVLAVRPGPLFRYLFIDSKFYDAVGARLAAGDGFPDGPFFMNVLYGVFLGAVYAVCGHGDFGRLAVLVLQAISGAFACVLLVRIGEALDRPIEGRIAGAALAVFGPAIFYDAAWLTPSLLLLLTTAATLAAVRVTRSLAARDAGREGEVVGGAIRLGALTGLLILGRASHALLLAGWAVVLLRSGRAGVRATLVMTAAAGLLVLPVTLRNLAVSGEWIPVTANGGMALWAGNHEGATGIYSQPAFLSNPVPEKEAEDYRAEASRRDGRELTLAGSSAYWTKATLERWLEHPGAFARLALRKLRFYFHATEAQTNLSYYFARDFSPVLQIVRLNLGWVLPFAILGFFTDFRTFLLPAVPIAVSLLTCLLFYVSSEYRHPVVPSLLLFAAAGARRAFHAFRHGGNVRRTLMATALLLLLVGTNLRDPFLARLSSRRVDYYNFAALAEADGRLAEAERFARRSIALDPMWPVSRNKLAGILQEQGRVEEAGAAAEEAARLSGAAPSASMQEALARFREGRFEEALAAFLALAEEGGDARATALNNAGLCAMRLSRGAQAESLLTVARRADPAYVSPVIHLGRLALAQGRREAAAQFAREALAIAPGDGRAQRLLARATGTAPLAPPGDADAE